MPRLRIRLFGAYQVTVEEAAVSGFASDKVRALLAYLAIEVDQPQRREKLAGLLWPDYPQASAQANLRTALANLRRVIGDPAATPPYLLISRQTLQFNREAGAGIDVVSFTALSANPELAVLEQAVELYQGDFLEGFSLADASLFEEWALLNRERYRRLAMDALRRLAGGHEQRGDYERALPHAWRQVELDPWRETAQQQLIRLLALSGRRTDALVQYETCCRLLAEDLGVAPAKTTVALYDQIRSGQLVAAGQLPLQVRERAVEPPPFLDHGEPAGAESPVFVGREDELAGLGACLELAMAGQGRVFFVRGEAGSGKTALMAEFARRATETYRDLLVASGECSAYSGFGDPYLPVRGILAMLTGDLQAQWITVATSMGHARRLWVAMPSMIEALIDFGPQVLDLLLDKEALLVRASQVADSMEPWLQRLRQRLDQPRFHYEDLDQSQLFQQTSNFLRVLSGAHPLLLIIDDLQWADPATLGLLFHVGRRLQGSRILLLAAYRAEEVSVGRGGERHPLPKLVAEFQRTYGDICLDLDQVDESQGRAFVNAFLNTEPNRLGEDFRSVLFRHTRGHPLFTVELLRTIQEQGGLVRDETGCWATGPALDWESLPAKVKGVIEERLDRLDEHLREILTAACVEGEQFTLQVVARALDIDENSLLRTLSGQLVRRHRLVRWMGGAQAGEQHLIRCRFAHALFQQYLYDRLGPGERQRMHAEIAATLEELYQGHTKDIATHLARHYSEAGDDLQALQYLTLAADSALASYANQVAETSYLRALDLAQKGTGRAHLLEGLGRALARQSRFAEALKVWCEAIELSRALGDVECVARLYARSSRAAWWGGNGPMSRQLCEEGLKHSAAAPESPGRARLLHEAARANYFGGTPEQAQPLCEQALAMAERFGVVDVQADALITQGLLLAGQAPQDALKALTKAVQLAEGANLPNVAFRAHANLAVIKGVIYGPQAACDENQHAVQLGRQAGSVAQEILALNNLLEGHLLLGELEQAQATLSRIRKLATVLDDPDASDNRIRRLEAAVLLYQGEWHQSASRLRMAQAEARRQNDVQALFNADLLLARALLEAYALAPEAAAGDWDEAERALIGGMELGRAIGDADTNVWCRAYLMAVYIGEGRLDEARAL
ncbi:MAG: AAA family ATPase, partial [Anaerolineae bacterium]|nr:AAA family ATPase [Anaerolineae bacterium]